MFHSPKIDKRTRCERIVPVWSSEAIRRWDGHVAENPNPAHTHHADVVGLSSGPTPVVWSPLAPHQAPSPTWNGAAPGACAPSRGDLPTPPPDNASPTADASRAGNPPRMSAEIPPHAPKANTNPSTHCTASARDALWSSLTFRSKCVDCLSTGSTFVSTPGSLPMSAKDASPFRCGESIVLRRCAALRESAWRCHARGGH